MHFKGLSTACEKDGWIKGPYESCYKFFTEPKVNWQTADKACKDVGGLLASLESEKEIIWMRGYRSYHNNLRETTWIGGMKNLQDGKWYWVSGKYKKMVNYF